MHKGKGKYDRHTEKLIKTRNNGTMRVEGGTHEKWKKYGRGNKKKRSIRKGNI